MELQIESYNRVGPLAFGDKPDRVFDILGSRWDIVSSFQNGLLARYFYPDLGIFVEFSYPGTLVAVEMVVPTDPIYESEHLLNASFAKIESWLRGIDPTTVVNEVGLRTFQCGIALYAPFHEEQREVPAEGVLAFEHGYYSKKYPTPPQTHLDLECRWFHCYNGKQNQGRKKNSGGALQGDSDSQEDREAVLIKTHRSTG